jgi:hypothetical protein
MEIKALRRLVPPLELVLALSLMGLMLLGSLLYYRAVRFQRYTEPALAMSQPRFIFTQNINRLLMSEFGGEDEKRVRLIGDSIFVEISLLTEGAHSPDETPALTKLARVFLSVMKDPETRSHIDLILVSTIVPITPDPEFNKQKRKEMRDRAGLVLNSLYNEEPEIEMNYSKYFAASVISADVPEYQSDWIEFRVVPSQQLHVEVIQRLQKYLH